MNKDNILDILTCTLTTLEKVLYNVNLSITYVRCSIEAIKNIPDDRIDLLSNEVYAIKKNFRKISKLTGKVDKVTSRSQAINFSLMRESGSFKGKDVQE